MENLFKGTAGQHFQGGVGRPIIKMSSKSSIPQASSDSKNTELIAKNPLRYLQLRIQILESRGSTQDTSLPALFLQTRNDSKTKVLVSNLPAVTNNSGVKNLNAL